MAELRRYRTVVSDSALWAGFEFRTGDVVISTPAKCGTTWMQMLCAMLIFDTAELHRPLTEISPWLDAVTYDTAAILAELESQQHRRFIKTHTPLDGLPFEAGVTYICVGRDPRDAMLSFEHAAANIHPDAITSGGLDPQVSQPPSEDPLERFWLWADAEFTPESSTFGVTLANLVHHVRTFWERRDDPQVALFHYADLKADLAGQLRRLATVLSIEASQQPVSYTHRDRAGAWRRREIVAQQHELLPFRHQRPVARPARRGCCRALHRTRGRTRAARTRQVAPYGLVRTSLKE